MPDATPAGTHPRDYLLKECDAAFTHALIHGSAKQVAAALRVHGVSFMDDVPWRERRLLLKNLRAIASRA